MKAAFFQESILSDFNCNSTSFIRGMISELCKRGHQINSFEKENNDALIAATKVAGKAPINEFKRLYPEINFGFYKKSTITELKECVKNKDLVFVHSSTDKDTIYILGQLKAKLKYTLIFIDSSLEAINNPEYLKEVDIASFDLILTSCQMTADAYLKKKLSKNVFVLHEAIDQKVFQPRRSTPLGQLVWVAPATELDISDELKEYLIQPVKDLRIKARVYAPRITKQAKKLLTEAGIEYGGWLPSLKTPEILPGFKTTIYIPGNESKISSCPTVQLMEKLSSAVPVITAGWEDKEKMLNKNRDYLFAKDGYEMKHYILEMMNSTLREVIMGHAIRNINTSHTCKNRVTQLEKILETIGVQKELIYCHQEFLVND